MSDLSESLRVELDRFELKKFYVYFATTGVDLVEDRGPYGIGKTIKLPDDVKRVEVEVKVTVKSIEKGEQPKIELFKEGDRK